ncbi:MAG: polyprenyl synthetase family protein [Bacteroidales bacterium]|nr:polyprenyl synthetase family protein [Bacteroidales bacterium]
MIQESQIEETLQHLFDEMEFTEQPAGLYDPLRYMIALGGKRIRPRLCLTVYGLFHNRFEPGVLQAAAALEVFHSFTLIHDDIMDKADIRRGQPTVYRKWDANTAILSGDVMSIDSYRRLAQVPADVLPAVLELFSRTAAQVCEGQQYDMEFESRDAVSMEEYHQMIGLKTAVLIACSARMGALLARVPEADSQAFYRYGYHLGMAFQIADDWLDTYGDTVLFGKSVGGDILNGKKTWLLTEAMARLNETGRARLQSALAMPAATSEEKAAKIAAVKAIYQELNVGDAALKEIEHFHTKALAELEPLSLSVLQKKMLQRYAASLTGRKK